jgi:hypothetical protein
MGRLDVDGKGCGVCEWNRLGVNGKAGCGWKGWMWMEKAGFEWERLWCVCDWERMSACFLLNQHPHVCTLIYGTNPGFLLVLNIHVWHGMCSLRVE